jgi:hypothetical protein
VLAARIAVLAIFGLALLPAAARAQAADVYSADTVWDWYNHADDLPALCGAASWFELDPDERVADAGCVQDAMRQLGASESAVRFFDATTQFLNRFDERGAIDFGHASSPWLNMGRGDAVLLNGLPSAILMSRTTSPRDDGWKSVPGYADVLRRYPQAFPWVEYGGPLAEQSSDDGRVMVALALDMRECRACANVATFRAELHFAPSGFITAIQPLPPGPPRP